MTPGRIRLTRIRQDKSFNVLFELFHPGSPAADNDAGTGYVKRDFHFVNGPFDFNIGKSRRFEARKQYSAQCIILQQKLLIMPVISKPP